LKYLIIIVIMLLIASPCSGQWEFMSGHYKETPALDGYSITWLAGGALTFGGILRLPELIDIKISPGKRFFLAIGLAYTYEIYKDAYRNKFPIDWGVDPSGADIFGDPLWFGLGAGLTYIAEKVSTKRKYEIVTTRNGLKLLVEF